MKDTLSSGTLRRIKFLYEGLLEKVLNHDLGLAPLVPQALEDYRKDIEILKNFLIEQGVLFQ